MRPHLGLGRVSWLASDVWDDGLQVVAPLPLVLAGLVDSLLEDESLKPQWFGGSASKPLRR